MNHRKPFAILLLGVFILFYYAAIALTNLSWLQSFTVALLSTATLTAIIIFLANKPKNQPSPTSLMAPEAQTLPQIIAAIKLPTKHRASPPAPENRASSPWVNRTALQHFYQQSTDFQWPDKYALVLLEAPNFKELIGILGYRQSDQLVLQVAAYLNKHLSNIAGAVPLPIQPHLNQTQSNKRLNKPSVYVSHLDYCQFAFFLDCTREDDQAVGRTRSLLNELKNSTLINEILITYSNPCAGITFSSAQKTDFYELLRQAQVASAQATHNYHRIERYHPKLEPQAKELAQLMSDLKQAIEFSELELRYQPRITLDDKKITGIEALVHWNHPELGTIPPSKFVPLAESTGNIKDLTDWTIKQVTKDASLALSIAPELQIAISISPYSLLQPNFSFFLNERLFEEEVSPRSITLEIRENVILRNNPLINKVIQDLKEDSFSLAIDDFGTGYGSLHYLRDSPVSEIKINKIFIKELSNHKTDQTIVKGIVNMSHNMGIKVIAEGIESAETLDLLNGYNCDTGQGPLFSEPTKIAMLLEQLATTSIQPKSQLQTK